MTLYSDVAGYKHFGGPCCLHLQGAVNGIKRIVFLDFIHRLVSQEQTQFLFSSILFVLETPDNG
jgi:hypothetical protein